MSQNIHEQLLEVLEYLQKKFIESRLPHEYGDQMSKRVLSSHADNDPLEHINAHLTADEVQELIGIVADVFDRCIEFGLSPYLPSDQNGDMMSPLLNVKPAVITQLQIPGDWSNGKFLVCPGPHWKSVMRHLLSRASKVTAKSSRKKVTDNRENVVSPKTYSVRDLTIRFGVAEHTVLEWIKSGELKAVNVGRSAAKRKPRWRITSEALSLFESRRLQVPPPPPRPMRRRSNRKQSNEIVFFE